MKKLNIVISIIALLVLVLGLLLAIGAETENPGRERHGQGVDITKEDIPRLVEIIRIWKLVDELELDDKQLIEFLPRFKEFNDLKAKYYRDRRNSINNLSKFLETGASEAQLQSALNEYREVEMSFYESYKGSITKLNSGLTVKQQARFVVFEDKYRNDIRNLIRKLNDLSNLRDNEMKP